MHSRGSDVSLRVYQGVVFVDGFPRRGVECNGGNFQNTVLFAKAGRLDIQDYRN